VFQEKSKKQRETATAALAAKGKLSGTAGAGAGAGADAGPPSVSAVMGARLQVPARRLFQPFKRAKGWARPPERM
jgi:hypothetical protein